MNKNDYKELDETIKAKLQPFLYNEGRGKMVPVAHLACLRNRDRALSKQVCNMHAQKQIFLKMLQKCITLYSKLNFDFQFLQKNRGFNFYTKTFFIF